MEAIIPCYQALQACRVLCVFFFCGSKLDRSQGVFYQQEREGLWVGRNADTNERKYKPTNGVGFCDLFAATFWAWLPWEAGPKWYAIKHNISSGSPERSGG